MGGETYHIPILVGLLFLIVADVLTPIIYYGIKFLESMGVNSTTAIMIFATVILLIFGGLALRAVFIRTK